MSNNSENTNGLLDRVLTQLDEAVTSSVSAMQEQTALTREVLQEWKADRELVRELESKVVALEEYRRSGEKDQELALSRRINWPVILAGASVSGALMLAAAIFGFFAKTILGG